MSRPIRAAVLMAAVLTVTVGWPNDLQPAVAVEDAGPAAQAMEWRQAHGLPSDADHVRRSLEEPAAFPVRDWAWPLSVTEAGELARRARIQGAKGRAEALAATYASYAGMHTDNRRGGVLVFSFAGDGPTAGELARLLPAGANVEVRLVDRTYADLRDTKDRIAASIDRLAGTGVVVNSLGLNTETNSVVVGLERRDAKSEASLEDRFGPGIQFRQRSVGVFDNHGCTTDEHCWPPKGGFDITARDMTSVACTSGFIVKRTDLPTVRQILTAGHCLAKAGGVGKVWEHNAGGPDIGTAQTNTFAEHAVLNGFHDSDVGLIGIQSTSLPAIKNQFIAGISGGPILASVTSYFHHSSQDVGDHVCRFGIASNRDCGLITEEEARNKSCLNSDDTNCKWIQRTWVLDFDSCGGDSGGPVFLYDYPADSVHVAFGTHVHSTLGCSSTSGDSWYSPYDIGRNEWQEIHPTIQWNICTSSSC